MTETHATVFTLDLTLIVLTLIFSLTPQMMGLTRVYGVSIPLNHIHHPAINQAHRHFYRIFLTSSQALTLTSHLLTKLHPASFLILITIAPLLLMALYALASSRASKHLKTAKAQENWYDGRDIGKTITLTLPQQTQNLPIKQGGFYASLALILAVTGYLALQYPTLPDPFPIHYNALGEADTWTPKTPWAVFGTSTGIMLLLLAGMWGCLPLMKAQMQTNTTTGQSKLLQISKTQRQELHKDIEAIGISTDDYMSLRSQLINQTAFNGIGRLCFGTTLGASYLNLIPHINAPTWASHISVPLFLLLIFGLVAFHIIIPLRQGRALDATIHQLVQQGKIDITQPEAPDTTDHYRAGLIYKNKENPALFVPKPIGAGWTLNYGHPWAWPLTIFFGITTILPPILLLIFIT